MLIKNKIIRDTILLTIMQLCLDTASLFLNSFITHRIGTSAIGILMLTGSFLGFAGILSNGNAFLCTSRLISEELGKTNGAPEKVLFHGIKLCLLLSTAVSAVILILSERINESFFSGAEMSGSIRLMPIALMAGAVSSCFKGYFNAIRRPSICAFGDIGEFFIRSGVIILSSIKADSPSEYYICGIMISGIIAGNLFSLLFSIIAFMVTHPKSRGKCSLSFRAYAGYAFPIMGGGILTAALSSTNDALIPICLRQNGDTVSEALSRFGIFEAIVIPALFFPSVVLCSVSGIIVSESARATAAGNTERVRSFAGHLMDVTLVYAVFSSAVLIRFGMELGELLGGEELAGTIIRLTAPVVPFIYLEIVLEALIKGTGQQAFSSLNYLVEYIVRISAVLILVPIIGFSGVVVSYYASNIVGNTSRFIRLIKKTGMDFRPFKMLVVPVAYVFMTLNFCELIVPVRSNSVPSLIIFVLIWGISYISMMKLLGKFKSFRINKKIDVVQSIQ